MPARITLYTLKVDGKRKQGLRSLRRYGATSGLSSGQHLVQWTGESIAGKILLDILRHRSRRTTNVLICHAGDNVDQPWLTIIIYSGTVPN